MPSGWEIIVETLVVDRLAEVELDTKLLDSEALRTALGDEATLADDTSMGEL